MFNLNYFIMRKITLLFTMLIGCSLLLAQQPEVVLTDFDGQHFAGVTYSHWSYYYAADTVDNPVKDGINTSATAVYYPCHWWESYWGWIPSFQVFKPVPVDITNDNAYFYLEILIIQDTIVEADTVNFEIKFKGGADPEAYSETVKLPVTAGGENVWQAVTIPIPQDMVPTDHPQVELMISPSGSTIATYYDNFGFTNTEAGGSTGISSIIKQNDFNVTMLKNHLYIRMDQTAFVNDVQVYDITGKLMFQRNINSMEKDFSMTLDLSTGVYIVKVSSGQQVRTKKFVIF
jgi:hypothetical protein